MGAKFESVAKMGAIVVSVEGGVEFCTRGVEFVMKSVSPPQPPHPALGLHPSAYHQNLP